MHLQSWFWNGLRMYKSPFYILCLQWVKVKLLHMHDRFLTAINLSAKIRSLHLLSSESIIMILHFISTCKISRFTFLILVKKMIIYKTFIKPYVWIYKKLYSSQTILIIPRCKSDLR